MPRTIPRVSSWVLLLSRLGRSASIMFCGVLPFITLGLLIATTVEDDAVAFDFRPLYAAGGAVLRGDTPYPPADDPLTASSGAFVYPPPVALAAIPFHALPLEAAGVLVMALLALAAIATLLVLGVRDWRCYGVIFLWPPVLSAIQTGNLTLFLGLAAALAWRSRDRALASSTSVGLTVAAKFFLWPLVVWLASTRRFAAAVLACAIGLGLLLASWAVIGFTGLLDYPDLIRRLQDSVGPDSYTTYIVALDLGAPQALARLTWLALGMGLVIGVVLTARWGDERSAFILALACALAMTPIVWLHYFALLLVVVALARPRLGFMWFIPLGMVVTPGSGHPAPFETAWTLGVASLTIALALRASRSARSDPAGARIPSRQVESTA